MKISLLEPIGIDAELMDKLSAPLKEMGHEFVYYDNKTTDKDELLKRATLFPYTTLFRSRKSVV